MDRLEMTSEMYREHIRLAISAFASDKHYAQQLDVVNLEKLLNVIHYQQGDFSDLKFYQDLSEKIHDIQKSNQIQKNIVFYLAVAARFFGSIVEKLGVAQLLKESENSWKRVIVEKPFGHDVESSKVLNLELRKQLHERQIYRMDHFLGKETVQNIMMLRFSNAIFEPLWNREHIDHIQITVAETVGVEKRAAFYESTGAMRDMVPNHVFQLLALTTMEPPASFSADAVRNEKTKVLPWYTHYSVSPDGNMAFFVSNAAGGKGKRDIYFIEKKNGAWGQAQNMGGMINTPNDEETPFVGLDNNVLYFASNDTSSMGGFDKGKTTKGDHTLFLFLEV